MCMINKLNHSKNDRENVKHKSISMEIILVQENIKEKKKMKFLLKQLNSKYSIINNKHKHFIFKIYFVNYKL